MKIFLDESLAAMLRTSLPKIVATNEASVLLGCRGGYISTPPAGAQLPSGWCGQGWILATVQLTHDAHLACGGTSATPAIFYRPLRTSQSQRVRRTKIPVTVYLHPHEAAALRALAEKKGMSQSDLGRDAVLLHLDKHRAT
jgi:hypothetical protein